MKTFNKNLLLSGIIAIAVVLTTCIHENPPDAETIDGVLYEPNGTEPATDSVITFQKLFWDTTCSSNLISEVQQTADGGYIVSGNICSSTGCLLKTDAKGCMTWKSMPLKYSRAYSVEETCDGGYIVTGHVSVDSGGLGSSDIFLVKVDSRGNTAWIKTFGSRKAATDEGYSVRQTSDGGYIVCGHTSSFDIIDQGVSLSKTDSDGNMVWTKKYGRSNDCYGYSVQQTNDGGYVIAGSYGSETGKDDVYLVKTDADGDTVWTRRFGAESGDREGFDVVQTNDGGYIVAGEAGWDRLDGIILLKADADGNMAWTRTLKEVRAGKGRFLHPTNNGEYLVTACITTLSSGNQGTIFLFKTNAAGDSVWSRTLEDTFYPGPFSSYGESKALFCGNPRPNLGIHPTNDGGYVAAGSTEGDAFSLIKTDENGNY